MRSFLLSILGFFCITLLSAQEISEDQFEPKLKEKQQELYKIIDEKDSLSNEIAILSKQISTISDETVKKNKENEKKNLENQVTSLTKDITKKCNDFAEYHTLLKKHQGVSDELLNNYKVRVCQLYVTETNAANVTVDDSDDRVTKELEKRQTSIDNLVEKKDEYDELIADWNKEIKRVEGEIKDTDENDVAYKDLTDKLEEFTKTKDSIVTEDKKLAQQIMETCEKFKEYKKFLKEHENVKDSILDLYKARNCRLFEKGDERDPKKFIIIGDNKPVEVDSLFSNTSATQVLADVFSIDSKTNLGTFEIPGDNSFINFYARNNEESTNLLKAKNTALDSESYALSIKQIKQKDTITPTSSTQQLRFVGEVPEGALFKSIQIELREGGIVDTRLVLLSTDRKFEFYFEGTAPVSILNYSRKVKESYLSYSHYVSIDGKGVYNENSLRNLKVRYTEVLDYHPNAGSNYVPDDVSYKFPSDKLKEAKEVGRRSYQVINDNHLQHVLDLRTYTDLLGLFGDEANGLFQIEGKAEFFIHPFNLPREAFYYLKKVSPYVRYSRFDDDNDFLLATMPTMTEPNPNPDEPDNYFFNDRKLDLLERSNLEMGLDINVINFRLFKESPFWTSLYVPLSYNVTKVRTNAAIDNNDANFKTLGVGIGANIEIRRFNNFGLNLGYEIKGYSFIGDYTEFNLSEPGYMRTQAVKAEIFYYPGLDKSNSIFLRMKSIRDISSGKGDSFFQLQVGYRFTLGIGAIKAR